MVDMNSDFNTDVVWVNILSNKVQECLLWTHIGFKVNCSIDTPIGLTRRKNMGASLVNLSEILELR
jgi:hypothetical protein